MTRLLAGLMLLPFIVAALYWALPRLVRWPDGPWPERTPLYRERAGRLRKLIEIDAPPIVIYQGARLLLSAEHGSDWRAILAWAASAFSRAAEWRVFQARAGCYMLTHHCSWERACDALESEERVAP